MNITLSLGLDHLFFAERFIPHIEIDDEQRNSIIQYRIRGQELLGWERLLAEARANFFSSLCQVPRFSRTLSETFCLN